MNPHELVPQLVSDSVRKREQKIMQKDKKKLKQP